MEAWLHDAGRYVRAVAPDLGDLVDDYLGEARFGASIIAAELSGLRPDARVLEIGAGTLLLSCALQANGYHVTAVEPVGRGFSHMERLRTAVLAYAEERGCSPLHRPTRAEALDMDAEVDFAFSINVMEHVDDVATVLRRVWSALRPGGAYRFVCPNYRFPFEPHFGIPTCFGKSLTWRVFRRRILASRLVADPAGTWESLNWISVPMVRRICREQFGVAPEFDRDVFYRFVRRAVDDPAFQRRHGGGTRWAAALDGAGLTRLVRLVPVGGQPAMSCRLARPSRDGHRR